MKFYRNSWSTLGKLSAKPLQWNLFSEQRSPFTRTRSPFTRLSGNGIHAGSVPGMPQKRAIIY